MAKILGITTVQTTEGSRAVYLTALSSSGELVLHRSTSRGWTITHRRSGRYLVDKVSRRFDATRMMKYLDSKPVWGFDEPPAPEEAVNLIKRLRRLKWVREEQSSARFCGL